MAVTTILITAGIPSAITAFCVWILEKKITDTEKKREKQQAEREEQRQEMLVCILDSINAALGLAEATAKALERTPSIDCNGDMHQALDYVQSQKHNQKEFLIKAGVKSIYESD